MSNTYKIILVGAGGAGKTAFAERLLTGKFRRNYNATIGVEVRTLTTNSPNGEVSLAMWDCAGLEKFQGLKEGYYHGADAAILMYSAQEPETRNCLDGYAANVLTVAGNIPIVYVASKCEDGWDIAINGDLCISTKNGEGLQEVLQEVISRIQE